MSGSPVLPPPTAKLSPAKRSHSGRGLDSPVVDNPTPQQWLPPTSYATKSDKLVIVMVGLPARGKSYITRRVSQYINFFYGTPIKVFNVGDVRRAEAGAFQPASFFDPDNAEAAATRKRASEVAMAQMCEWMASVAVPKGAAVDGAASPRSKTDFRSGDFGAVAFFDATNSTRERRAWILERVRSSGLEGVKVIFIESILTDDSIVEANILRAKVGVKDYAEIGDEEALRDFRERIAQYERVYESLGKGEEHLSWIRLVDGGREIGMNRIRGFLPTRVAAFLMNVHMERVPLYFTRHGQSEYNEMGKIGGDSGLTAHGEEYARALGEWAGRVLLVDASGEPQLCRLWTSSLQRAIRTARHIPTPVVRGADGAEWVQMRPKVFRNLDEIYAGICDGMTYEEIQDQYPQEAAARRADKFTYRYPRGESYGDLILRLEPIAHEIERQREPLLIVAHQAILRVIYAYLMGISREEVIKVTIPLNTVFCVTPDSKGSRVEKFTLLDHPEGVVLDPASH